MEKLNVAIADDNERMTDILGQMIEEDKELTLVGKAHNGEEICNIIREKEPDVVVLDMTGGIVQGMSGSPVIQNGKFAGAITHVFVQDAAGGYGIFAETMIENVEKE